MNSLLLTSLTSLIMAVPSMSEMRWERRIVLVSAPTAQDMALGAQRHILAGWKSAADARDLSVVEVIGDSVSGANETAASLRRKYGISAGAFTAILIGKDGGEKLRSAKPIPAAVLEATIDAMPMRRSGRR